MITGFCFFFLSTSFIKSTIAQIDYIIIENGASNPQNNKFYEPSIFTTTTNTPVTWKNSDGTYHTVTSFISYIGPLDIYDSGPIQPGNVFTHTYETAGTFEYYCTIHPFMKGKIIVN